MASINSMSATVDSVAVFFEHGFADIRRQSAWDFSGRQIYLGDHSVSVIYLALDPTKYVLDQAIAGGCELIVTHHPLFLSPAKGLSVNNSRDAFIIQAIKNNISVLSYHTNLDMSPGGLNSYLLQLLSAKDGGILESEGEIPYIKLIVFTPVSHEKAVLDAIDKIGGGQIGNYRRCAFTVEGTGTFTPIDGANPFTGSIGKEEYVKEARQEILVPAANIQKAVDALKKAHPYETPAFDIVPVKSPEPYGFIRIGIAERKYPFEEFISLLKVKFKTSYVRSNMKTFPDGARVFAVCCGSGASLWKVCLKHGIKVFVTGDVKHHDALDAKEAGVCIIDIGHYHSERVYMTYLAGLLEDNFNVKTFVAEEDPPILLL
ncbi:MAG: Nif3-like dinuclear metal center hexameric protein [Deferribacteraceae bacterium]|jgi:dinuclear metal center YbgI/SA1388 family protein|nr:Nif3-like dinuclear metal center hexameric protein [Deferribacteraceae bacterium]